MITEFLFWIKIHLLIVCILVAESFWSFRMMNDSESPYNNKDCNVSVFILCVGVCACRCCVCVCVLICSTRCLDVFSTFVFVMAAGWPVFILSYLMLLSLYDSELSRDCGVIWGRLLCLWNVILCLNCIIILANVSDELASMPLSRER